MLAHKVAGRGEPVLLLNGGLMSMAAWDPVALPLEESFRVLRCDLRGQLLSPGEPPATLDGHAAEVVALLDRLGLASVHVVGASYGALVGIVLAASHPGRATSLTAVTATERIPPDSWPAAEAMREACLAAADGGDGGRVLDLILETTFSPAYLAANREGLRQRRGQIAALPRAWFLGLAGLMAPLRDLDLTPRLRDVRCPVLVIAAEHDATFPPERSRALCVGLGGARLEIVRGSGHALVVEQPAELVSILREFISTLARGGQS